MEKGKFWPEDVALKWGRCGASGPKRAGISVRSPERGGGDSKAEKMGLRRGGAAGRSLACACAVRSRTTAGAPSSAPSPDSALSAAAAAAARASPASSRTGGAGASFAEAPAPVAALAKDVAASRWTSSSSLSSSVSACGEFDRCARRVRRGCLQLLVTLSAHMRHVCTNCRSHRTHFSHVQNHFSYELVKLVRNDRNNIQCFLIFFMTFSDLSQPRHNWSNSPSVRPNVRPALSAASCASLAVSFFLN